MCFVLRPASYALLWIIALTTFFALRPACYALLWIIALTMCFVLGSSQSCLCLAERALSQAGMHHTSESIAQSQGVVMTVNYALIRPAETLHDVLYKHLICGNVQGA